MAEGKSVDKDAWVLTQEKTFTRWMNTYLKQRGMDVAEGALAESMGSGLALLNLLEVIGKDSVKTVCNFKINKNPKMRIQNLENCNAALDYLKAKEIKLVNVGANDLVDGNLKIILGMLWTIILRFEISEDGKKGLLLWCQRCTKEYDNVDIANFDRSWADGLGFCALIHHHRPDLLDYESLSAANAADNCELAFKIAEEQLGIDRLLDVEDIAGNPKPDDKSIIAYLTQFYKLFASQMKNENFVKTVERAVAITRRHEKLIEDFEAGTAELKAWMDAKTGAFTAYETGSTTAAIKDALDEFYAYKSEDKPPHQGRLLELEGVLGALQSSCKNNDRPVYAPRAGHGPAELEAAWAALEEAENAYEGALRELYSKFQEVDFKTAKFQAKAGKMDEWATAAQARFDDQAALASPEVAAAEAERLQDAHKIYEEQLGQYQEALQVLLAIVADVQQVPQHEQSAPCAAQGEAIGGKMAALAESGAAYGAALDAKLAGERDLAATLKQAAKDGELLLFDLENLDEMIAEPVIANSAEACAEQLGVLQGTVSPGIDAAGERLDRLAAAVAALTAGGRAGNLRGEIVALTAGEGSPVEALRQKLAQRVHRLVTQQAAEEQKEKLRLAFAEVAAQIKAHCSDKAHEVDGLGGSLKEQFAAVEKLLEEHAGHAGMMEGAEAAATALEEAHVIINPHTPETIHSLRALWAELTKTFNRARSQLEENILAEEGAKLTPEQYKEIKEVFTYFDQDGDNALSLQEFKDGCEGMGLGLEDDEMESKMKQYSGGADAVNFEQFSDFMLKELETGSTQPDVLNAFTTLAGAPFITDEQLAQNFKNADLRGYLEANMPAVEGGEPNQKNYGVFTENLFSK